MVIAVDFDGTLAEHHAGGMFPQVGIEIPGAVRWCRRWQEHGADLMLWTMRTAGEGLEEALGWCLKRGLEFWGVNENPYQSANWSPGRKQFAHLYVDDMAAGVPLCFPEDGRRPFLDWGGRWPHDVLAMVQAKVRP